MLGVRDGTCSIASANSAVSLEIVPAQATRRDGVHSACARWHAGMCSGSVT